MTDIMTPAIHINGEEFRGLVNRDSFKIFRNGVKVTGPDYPDLFLTYLEQLKHYDEAI
jgi:hypothetical protein